MLVTLFSLEGSLSMLGLSSGIYIQGVAKLASFFIWHFIFKKGLSSGIYIQGVAKLASFFLQTAQFKKGS
jgi:hypothetical protein